MNRRLLPILSLALVLIASSAGAFTIYLKDGSKIAARQEYEIQGEKAIIILQNGTRTSIDASEIDVERTREANRANLGSALVIEDGRVTELSSNPPAPKRETLADLIAERDLGPSAQTVGPRGSAPRGTPRRADEEAVPADLRTVQRRPFGDLEVAAEVQRQFRAQGVEQILIYQGSQPRFLLLDVVTNSEAAVFRTLEVAASCLQHIRSQNPEAVGAFELVLATAEREPAGQFLITPEAAAELAEQRVETSAFFIDRVRF